MKKHGCVSIGNIKSIRKGQGLNADSQNYRWQYLRRNRDYRSFWSECHRLLYTSTSNKIKKLQQKAQTIIDQKASFSAADEELIRDAYAAEHLRASPKVQRQMRKAAEVVLRRNYGITAFVDPDKVCLPKGVYIAGPADWGIAKGTLSELFPEVTENLYDSTDSLTSGRTRLRNTLNQIGSKINLGKGTKADVPICMEVVVNLQASSELIDEEFKHIIKEQQRQYHTYRKQRYAYSRADIVQLETYLQIYDLRQSGMKYSQIVEKVYASRLNRPYNSEAHRRDIIRENETLARINHKTACDLVKKGYRYLIIK